MTVNASTVLHLRPTHRTALNILVTSGFPHETCGLLVGRQDGERVHVDAVYPARNLNRERAHDRFELDPDDFAAVDRAARADGLDIVGIWHSHPDHPAVPSATDLDAAWEGYSYLIVAVSREDAADWNVDFRSWRLLGERFHEETLAQEN